MSGKRAGAKDEPTYHTTEVAAIWNVLSRSGFWVWELLVREF
jgi:hypothetical protein